MKKTIKIMRQSPVFSQPSLVRGYQTEVYQKITITYEFGDVSGSDMQKANNIVKSLRKTASDDETFFIHPLNFALSKQPW